MAGNQQNMDYGAYVESTSRQRRQSRSRAARSSPTQSTHIPDTHIPETHSPAPTAPTQMSVEDFMALPGRDRLPRLHPDCRGRDIWFEDSHTGVSKSINRMLNGMLQHPYPTYSSMPIQEKDMWFRQFAQEFRWDSHLTATVRREFDKKVARSYSWKINEWKDKWKQNDVPRELASNPELFHGFIAYWSQEPTKESASIHSASRNSTRKGKGKATHNLGAKSKATKAKELFREDGVEPSNLRLLEAVHTGKDGVIRDQVTLEIVENVRRMGEEFLLSQPIIEGTPPLTEVPLEKVNEFVYEAIPKSKGRNYGLPDETSSSVTSRYYGGSHAAHLEAEVDELKTTVQRLTEENQTMAAKMDAFFARYPPPPP